MNYSPPSPSYRAYLLPSSWNKEPKFNNNINRRLFSKLSRVTKAFRTIVIGLIVLSAGLTNGQAEHPNNYDLYPIAISADTLAGAQVGDEFDDILNGIQPGNFGWLTWSGSPSANVLATSLTPSGNDGDYVNPDDSEDTQIDIGDWVQGKPGVSNAKKVRNALDLLKQQDAVVLVWDQTRGQGNNADYRVVAFAKIRLLSYNLSKKKISARFLGFDDCTDTLAPVANAQTVNLDEDTGAVITLTAVDVDGDPLTYSIIQAPVHGEITGTAPELLYAPDENYNGPDSLIFEVSDPAGLTSQATVTINVAPINDAPAASPLAVIGDEDQSIPDYIVCNRCRWRSNKFYGRCAATKWSADRNSTQSYLYSRSQLQRPGFIHL